MNSYRLPNRRRFKIGQVVRITGPESIYCYPSTNDADRIEFKKDVEQKFGVIVGFTCRFVGKVREVSYGHYWSDMITTENYLVPSERRELWQVKFTVNGRIHLFRDECLEEQNEISEVPLFPSSWDKTPEKEKQKFRLIMREEMSDWPRDEKGRWVKRKPSSVTS